MLQNSQESLPQVCEMLKKAQLTANCITTLQRGTKDTQTNLRWPLLGWDHRAGRYEDEPFAQDWGEALQKEAKAAKHVHKHCLAPSCTCIACCQACCFGLQLCLHQAADLMPLVKTLMGSLSSTSSALRATRLALEAMLGQGCWHLTSIGFAAPHLLALLSFAGQAFACFLEHIRDRTLPYGPLLGWSWVQGYSFTVPPGHNWPFPSNMDHTVVWGNIGDDAVAGITSFLERLNMPVVKKHDLPHNMLSSMSSMPKTQSERNWELIGAHFNQCGLKHLKKMQGYEFFFDNQRLM